MGIGDAIMLAGLQRGRSNEMRFWLAVLAFLFLVLGSNGCLTSGDQEASGGQIKEIVKQQASKPDAPRVHGMLLLGSETIYLSYLGSKGQPLDYQVLMEVELVRPGLDPEGLYRSDRHLTGEGVYTVESEAFSLPELFGAVGKVPIRTNFKVTLFRGDIEQGGSPLLVGVTVKVKRVIFVNALTSTAPRLPRLKYFLFGNAAELFAAHVVSRATDFVQLEAVSLTSGVPSESAAQQIRTGIFVEMDGTVNAAAEALKEGREYEAVVQIGAEKWPIRIKSERDIYTRGL